MGSQSAVPWRPARWSIIVIASLALFVTGCATGGPAEEAAARPEPIDPRLDDPSGLAVAPHELPIPPGLPAELFDPAAASENAEITLGEAIERYVSLDVPVAGADPGEDGPPDPDSERRAVQAYAAARLAYLDGELRQAERLVRESLELDRSSGAGWQLLADIYEAGGETGVAIQVYEEALRREPDNVQSLFRVGSYVAQAGRSDLAARLLAPVLREASPARDPAMRSLALARFGLAMFDLGAWRAAETAFIESADLLPRAAASAGRLRDELIQLDRHGADILIMLGDISLHRGDPATAGERYDGAARRQRLPGPDLIRRRMLAALRDGRPATAANILVRTVDEAPDRLTANHAQLVRYLLEVTTLDDPIAEALSLRADDQPDQEVIQLMAAMAEPTDEARTRLESVVRRHDCTQASRVAYISTCDRPADALAAVARQLDERPNEAEAWVRALMRVRSPIDWAEPLADMIPTDRGERLLRAILLAQLGRWAEADAVGEQLERDTDAYVPFLLATGRNGDVPDAAERLRDPAFSLRARIEAAGRSQRFDLALDLSTSLVEDHAATAGDLLRHAGLLAQRGRHDEQVEALERALELRPGTSRPSSS
jgi:tetratricopeptide (TPR) repeat protein